jgi:2-aminoadipate transaminase
MLDQHIAAILLKSGRLHDNLRRTVSLYRRKRDFMLAMLERHMPSGVSWTRPEGGLFVFLTLPEHIDTVALYDSALSAGVAYVSGAFFHPDGGGRNTMRLNYSFMDMERIEEGISVLAGIIRAHINAAR